MPIPTPRVPTDGDSHPAFKVLHIKGAGAAIEPSMDYSASHVRWLVSSLSPVGPLIRSEEPLLYHGAVVLYKAVDSDPSLLFRVYVATNNESFIKVGLAKSGGALAKRHPSLPAVCAREALVAFPHGKRLWHIRV